MLYAIRMIDRDKFKLRTQPKEHHLPELTEREAARLHCWTVFGYIERCFASNGSSGGGQAGLAGKGGGQ